MSKQLPEHLPPLPEGAVYLGLGGKFTTQRLFEGWALYPGESFWDDGDRWRGDLLDVHYAAPADSEIARLNSHGNNKLFWDTAIATPDLIIPAEVYSDSDTLACIAQCAYNAGYRIEWDSTGLRGYRDE